MRVGVIFGGQSREREVSFAGGRTVYDNLDKTIFEAVPIFVDSFGNFVKLNWQNLYKGSIRDFYPPLSAMPKNAGEFQLYCEHLGNLSKKEQLEITKEIGEPIAIEELKELIDFAFLALHGPFGEDGSIQGVLEYLKIPYSGSGLFASSFGISKSIQRHLMNQMDYEMPKFCSIKRADWLNGDKNSHYKNAQEQVGKDLVVKSANQGSSIGVSILKTASFAEFEEAVNRSFFIKTINLIWWKALTDHERNQQIVLEADFRTGIGLPVEVENEILYQPIELLYYLNKKAKSGAVETVISSLDQEQEVLIESIITGKEFSCIVVKDVDGKTLSLPPTEIVKGSELFDYRSKYLPGISRKVTPIRISDEKIREIRKSCEHLFTSFLFDVYARIDGFITDDGKIFLNDPNTTSGMMPSSFFFHQAAEIGLNPSQFLTFIIYASLNARSQGSFKAGEIQTLFKDFKVKIKSAVKAETKKQKIAVFLGGYSTERHISVESGRNIYEKLASSGKYEPIPIFVTGNYDDHSLHIIPINILLKDNADDISEKISNYSKSAALEEIIAEAKSTIDFFGVQGALNNPKETSYEELKFMVDGAFIALHGRPGEDGQVQRQLEVRGIPYNGSREGSSKITINKFEANEILQEKGFLIPKHEIIHKIEWNTNPRIATNELLKEFSFPLVAKPADDGCSSAVKKINTKEELYAFADLIFREKEELMPKQAKVLKLKLKEEFPMKEFFVIEELVLKGDAKHFLEITGGLLTKYNGSDEIQYEIFEPSETLTSGDVLSLEEKFLAGEGQNITPARFSKDLEESVKISELVRNDLLGVAKALDVQGYARIDAFVRIFDGPRVETIIIEVNSLPGMTPATCIFHQTAINGYKPYNFIDKILEFGYERQKRI
ncbi:MAG: UDP-N-acetylmuramate--alanine ligase [Sphingobacteriales bacterium]|jgi:UDP-N-acetylmuramate--alanine ligase